MVGKEDVQLELYPLLLRLLRHSTPSTETANGWNGHATSWNSIVGGYGAAALSQFLTTRLAGSSFNP